MQSGDEIHGRRTCCTCHARNRSSAWRSQRGVLNNASNFRSGNFTFCTRPSIITLTALHPSQGRASASQRRLSSPLFLLCLQPSISSALNNNWYCRLEGGFVHTQRTPPGSAPATGYAPGTFSRSAYRTRTTLIGYQL